MRKGLRPEADREERDLLGDELAEQVVLLLEPGVLGLLADVLVPAEDEHGVERAGGLRLACDRPFDELVPLGGDHLAEELGSNEPPVRHSQHPHRANPNELRANGSLPAPRR